MLVRCWTSVVENGVCRGYPSTGSTFGLNPWGPRSDFTTRLTLAVTSSHIATSANKSCIHVGLLGINLHYCWLIILTPCAVVSLWDVCLYRYQSISNSSSTLNRNMAVMSYVISSCKKIQTSFIFSATCKITAHVQWIRCRPVARIFVLYVCGGEGGRFKPKVDFFSTFVSAAASRMVRGKLFCIIFKI